MKPNPFVILVLFLPTLPAFAVDADMSGDDWKARLAKSKFAGMKEFNRARQGHLALQDYRGAGVWYRNIMVRPVKAEGK